jgi:hypothetical protein
MSAIGRRDTEPERAVRSFLHSLGVRFRLHSRNGKSGYCLAKIPDSCLRARVLLAQAPGVPVRNNASIEAGIPGAQVQGECGKRSPGTAETARRGVGGFCNMGMSDK